MQLFSTTKIKMVNIITFKEKIGRISICFLISVLIFIARTGWATNYYIAQSASGIGDGTSCANARANTWDWSGVTSDDTVYICGSISSQVVIGASGTYGHPVTLKFCKDMEASCGTGNQGKLSTAVFPALGAIYNSGKSYLTIDGNNVGVIENTNNGDLLTYHNNSVGIYSNGDNVEIKNLTIQNIYVKVYNSEAAGMAIDGGGMALYGSNVSAHHNVITMAPSGITHINTSGATKSNISLHHNITYDTNWGIQAAVGVAGSISDSVYIYNNDITLTDAWTISTEPSWYHHNGSYCFSGDGLGLITNLSFYNNYIHSLTSHVWAASGFIHADYGIKSIRVYNNLLVGDVNGSPSPAFIFVNNGGTTNAVIDIYNNTIIGINSTRGIMLDTPGTGTKLTTKNNIIKGVTIGVQVTSPGNVTIDSDNNSFYNNSYVAYAGAYYTTLANWQTYLGGCPGSNNDCNSITSNPDLNSDYTEKPISPTRDAGTPLSSVFTTDIIGITRPQGTAWDIGAYEYSGGNTSMIGVYNAKGLSGYYNANGMGMIGNVSN